MLAERILILLYHPETGRPLVSSDRADLVLGGALLVELAERQRIHLTEPHRVTKNRTVIVVDPNPTGSDVLDEALRRISAQRSARAQVVVSKIAKGVRAQLLERLAVQGTLRSEKARLFGLIPVVVWPAVDRQQREDFKQSLRQVLVGQRPPTCEEAAILSLVHAVGGTAKILGGARFERRHLNQRAGAISEGDVTAEVVHQALKAAAF
jgi:hypothetical protein